MYRFSSLTLTILFVTVLSLKRVVNSEDIIPRTGVTRSSNGNTVWRFARFDNYTSYNIASKASNLTKMKELEYRDKIVAYDSDRNVIFEREDMVPVYSDDQAKFIILPNGFAYFYMQYGPAPQPLFLQTFGKDGMHSGDSISLTNCNLFSVVESWTSSGLILLAWIEISNNTASLKYRFLDSRGVFLSQSTLLDTGFWDESAFPAGMMSLSTTNTVNGGFLINWAGLDDSKLEFVIKSTYIPAQYSDSYKKPFILADHGDTGFLQLLDCGGIQAGSGHFCLYDQWITINATMFKRNTFMSTFSYTGAVYDVPTLLSSSIMEQSTGSYTADLSSIAIVLPYGGLLLSTGDNYTYLFNREWKATLYSNRDIVGYSINVLPNNTLLSLNHTQAKSENEWEIIQDWKAINANIPMFLPESKYANNPVISSTSPEINQLVAVSRNDLSITFLENPHGYVKSIGNISIYNSEYPYHPRQIVPIIEEGVLAKEFQTNILSSTLNIPDSEYFVVVDPGTFLSAVGDPLLGIPPNIWKFRTQRDDSEKDPSAVHFQIRVKSGGNSPGDLTTELEKFIPISESGRLETRLLRTDGQNLIYQLIIHGGEHVKRSARDLLEDFKEMLAYKDTTILSFGNVTQYIDARYGVVVEDDVTSHYIIHLVVAVVVLGWLAVYLLCRRHYPIARNSVIIMIGLCGYNFIVSTLYVLLNSGDVKQLQLVSCLLYILPFIINTILVTWITIRQVSRNAMFYVWFSKRTFVTTTVTLISASNPALLTLLSSRLFGINWLDAPVSQGFHKRVIYASMVNLATKEIPFLVIQVLYRKLNGYFKIIPYLCFISSILDILMGIAICGHYYWYHRKLQRLNMDHSSDLLPSFPLPSQHKYSKRVSKNRNSDASVEDLQFPIYPRKSTPTTTFYEPR
ncbi:hypothetical protein K7432_013072 [Basidiobolus ranarum]|uniref:Uncharacterized protein n=1 Tax=Basidiobolus ranarum TaxID=34480 RepID=A0ABR2WJV8_9FUNG